MTVFDKGGKLRKSKKDKSKKKPTNEKTLKKSLTREFENGKIIKSQKAAKFFEN